MDYNLVILVYVEYISYFVTYTFFSSFLKGQHFKMNYEMNVKMNVPRNLSNNWNKNPYFLAHDGTRGKVRESPADLKLDLYQTNIVIQRSTLSAWL